MAEASTLRPEVPFTIAVPEHKLESLGKKLEQATFPDELEDAQWKYGVPLADLQRLVARWKDGYNWRQEEADINLALPQFTRDIRVDDTHGALNVHYVHKKSENKNAIPLLFVHGWPGSFVEVQKILPLLTQSDSTDFPSFHVVALSLPGFGFSEAPRKQGFSVSRHADVGHKLMQELGYNEYVTQGGDWGFYITRRIAQLYGKSGAKAWHTNYPGAGAVKPTISQPLLFLQNLFRSNTSAEKAGIARTQWFLNEGMGYNQEQSTQPQTLGYALADSPVGLLAWIYEKLVNWSDGYPWSDDEILTWVSLYYFSRAGPAASLRIYYEATKAGDRTVPPKKKPTIPMGASYFPKELRRAPRPWTMNVGNLKFESEHTSGGHFAAHEKPSELVDDLRKMFGKGGVGFGVISGKNGYADN
ncbi:epoxide hydrolase 1 [Moniliophthora roreri MCA 2997]|uniref:Epoxide hydrolase 1 n=1 Tax=Moniliophthora roreri (strain MCA 2997) TaxID=1381753 RepID=V2X0P4_MONRO|nr:epoxide hydrolase 1 [Moniliophthora roreri MCA 2997]